MRKAIICGRMYEFNLGPVEFETLLGYAGSDVLQEAVNIGIELEEVTELRDTGLADEGMDIDELRVQKWDKTNDQWPSWKAFRNKRIKKISAEYREGAV